MEDVGFSEALLSPLLPCTVGSHPFSPLSILASSLPLFLWLRKCTCSLALAAPSIPGLDALLGSDGDEAFSALELDK